MSVPNLLERIAEALEAIANQGAPTRIWLPLEEEEAACPQPELMARMESIVKEVAQVYWVGGHCLICAHPSPYCHRDECEVGRARELAEEQGWDLS